MLIRENVERKEQLALWGRRGRLTRWAVIRALSLVYQEQVSAYGLWNSDALAGAEMWGEFQGIIKLMFRENNFCVRKCITQVCKCFLRFLVTCVHEQIPSHWPWNTNKIFKHRFYTVCITALSHNEIPYNRWFHISQGIYCLHQITTSYFQNNFNCH